MSELHNEPLTFEKVWAALMENREQMKDTDRRMKETDRLIGELSNRFGEIAEHLVLPGIVEKFNTLGFRFNKDCTGAKFRDHTTGRTLAEVDILLENGEVVIAVEVKTKLRDKDVDAHIARMEVLRSTADFRGDSRKYRGAIAAAILTDETRSYAHAAGFYVIEQSGDTMKLEIPEGFIPREW